MTLVGEQRSNPVLPGVALDKSWAVPMDWLHSRPLLSGPGWPCGKFPSDFLVVA